jgi:hypothetical protein
VDAAGVVTNHPTQGVVIVRCWIRAKGELELMRFVSQLIEHHPRLDPRLFTLGIDPKNFAEILRRIYYDREVCSLASQAGAPSAEQHWRAESMTAFHRGLDFVDIHRHYDADRNQTIIGCRRGIDCSHAGIKTHLATHSSAQVSGESVCIYIGGGTSWARHNPLITQKAAHE